MSPSLTVEQQACRVVEQANHRASRLAKDLPRIRGAVIRAFGAASRGQFEDAYVQAQRSVIDMEHIGCGEWRATDILARAARGLCSTRAATRNDARLRLARVVEMIGEVMA